MEQTQRKRPIYGGLTISNLKFDDKYSIGTLGCFATLVGDNDLNRYHILTCWHVLSKHGAVVNDPIFQPKATYDEIDAKAERGKGTLLGPVAKIFKSTPIVNHKYAYPGEVKINYGVDCGLGKVETGFKKCLGRIKNKNIEFENKIAYEEPNGDIKSISIVDDERVKNADIIQVAPYKVFKIGRKTAKTSGKIVAVDQSVDLTAEYGIIMENCITIIADNPNDKFADHSDSGSVLLNEKNKVVGLIFAGGDQQITVKDPRTNANIIAYPAYACHIHPILDYLGIALFINPVQSVKDKRNYKTESDIIYDGTVYLSLQQEQLKLNKLKLDLSKAESGDTLFNIFEKYRNEVVYLINQKQTVTLTWHRNNGPTFLAHFVKKFHEPDYVIPLQIKGITLSVLLKNMCTILYEHSTPGLKIAIEQYRENVISSAVNCNSLEELLTNICNYKPHEQLAGNN